MKNSHTILILYILSVLIVIQPHLAFNSVAPSNEPKKDTPFGYKLEKLSNFEQNISVVNNLRNGTSKVNAINLCLKHTIIKSSESAFQSIWFR